MNPPPAVQASGKHQDIQMEVREAKKQKKSLYSVSKIFSTQVLIGGHFPDLTGIWRCWGEGKTRVPRKKPLGARREPTTNSTQIWRWGQGSNLGHIGGRRVLSPLHHPRSPNIFFLNFISTLTNVVVMYHVRVSYSTVYEGVMIIKSSFKH